VQIPIPFHSYVIAGGQAADQFKARDIDCWILGVDNFTAVTGTILRYWDALGIGYDRVQGPYYECDEFYLVGEILDYDVARKPVQVFLTKAQSAPELLEQFDISTHMWAWEIDAGRTICVTSIDKSTTTLEQPRVRNFDKPLSTLMRLLRICDRYGLKPNPQDVRILLRGLDRWLSEEEIHSCCA
jgi:hypothetical protein